ncbi:MAG: adenosylmethionine--8-amino-7-oxononanoate transaminase [Rothia sp. (in: high G+C Gram-positive bacteria)]|nr:adenosylmethionine--8-amino-7-oxononanoate transaminase [Rothia sp. (in: high G+C Gram-positive bacteria)]
MFKNDILPGQNLVTRDRNLLWHPYAPLNTRPLYAVTAAHRSTLTLQDEHGKTYQGLDAMSSWWCQVHGYTNPHLDKALTQQIQRFSHVMFGGLTHQPAITLAEKLRDLTPAGLDHIFLADSGSVSVEVALKLAIQYQNALGRPHKGRFIALRGGYHGDTIGAMGVSDPQGSMHQDFTHIVQSQYFLPKPPAATYNPTTDTWSVDQTQQTAWDQAAEEYIATQAHKCAAIIVEPIVQGAGGMHFYHPQCLTRLKTWAEEHQLLLIFDEIATGFGRTGKLFAANWANVTPHVMTVGKAMTGGYMTQGAVIVHTDVAHVISTSSYKALMHGPTFMGNPLASAVSSASLDLLTAAVPTESHWETNVPRLSQALATGLEPARQLEPVHDVRTLGGIGVIELKKPVKTGAIIQAALERGVWVRPFRNLVYTMPTYISTTEELAHLTGGLVEAIKEVYPQ